MLKRVRELPAAKSPAGRESYVARDVREFCRNTLYEVAEVTCEGHGAKAVADALKHYIKGHPDQCAGVCAALRDGRAYLYRKGVDG